MPIWVNVLLQMKASTTIFFFMQMYTIWPKAIQIDRGDYEKKNIFIFIGSRVGQLLLVSKYNHFILNWFFLNVCLCMKIYKSYLTRSNSAFYLKMSCIQNWICRKFIPNNSHNLCVYIHAQFLQKSDFAFFYFLALHNWL